MGKMPTTLKKRIAKNIRDCRIGKFPGRGGAKRCAQAFGVSQQQWSSWETEHRTPEESRMEELAEFFGVTVEYLRADRSGEDFDGLAADDSLDEARPGDSAPAADDTAVLLDELQACVRKLSWLVSALRHERNGRFWQ